LILNEPWSLDATAGSHAETRRLDGLAYHSTAVHRPSDVQISVQAFVGSGCPGDLALDPG
jgi:hypothetical protein